MTKDGVYNWPKNRLKWGRDSERPAAHTLQTLTQVLPPPGLFLDNPNYRIIRRDRSRNGEGIMAYVRFNITVIRRPKPEPADIESLTLDVVHVTAHQVKVNLQSS